MFVGLLDRNRWILLGSFAFFAVGMLLGAWGSGNPGHDWIEPNGVGHLLRNNLFSCLLIASGFVTFGWMAVLYLFLNGFVLGTSIADQLASGMEPLRIVLLLAPHGIFEVPALIMSGAVGLKCLDILVRMLIRPVRETLLSGVKDTAVLLVAIVVFLVAAAWMETYITPLFK
jgi:uncharacterized membrane protein SpoIIM required for sporulation